MKDKFTSISFLIVGVYYIIAEFIAVLKTNVPFIEAYSIHTISELGVPIGDIYKGVASSYSPLFFFMNLAFILLGIILFIGYNLSLKKHINKNKLISHLLIILTCIGAIFVGIFHADNPLFNDYHILGAVLSILCGNIFLIFISKFSSFNENYKKISKYLGIIGLISACIMLILKLIILSNCNPVFERISVYTLIIWLIVTGIYLKIKK